MAQKKLLRFQEIKTFPNVLEYPENMKGNWKNYFKNDNSIVLELACGKGEYSVELGKRYPEKNFIGVDIKGNRIWKGAKTALSGGLKSVAFLRTQIQMIENYFNKDEVSEIWITFPDPHLRLSKMKKRLTHPQFLRSYQKLLKSDGYIHLKTDSPQLYNFTKSVINIYELDLIEDKHDLYASDRINNELKIKTHYEALDISKTNKVYYLKFILNKDLPAEKDKILKELFYEKHAG